METIKEIPFEEHQYSLAKAIDKKREDKSADQILAEEHLFQKMCSDLPLHQDKIKRDKDLYKEEFTKFLNVFTPKFNAFLDSPSVNHKHIKEVLIFLAHLSHIFPKQLAFIPAQLRYLLEHSYANIHPEIRLSIIDLFNLLRKRDLIDPLDILPLLFQLLTTQDKALRQKIQEVILNDLSRINERSKNHKVNKFIRNKCSEMLLNPNFKAARKTLNIMILLYKKKIWNDDKTVNAIAHACYSEDKKIAFAACKFFLSEYEEIEEEDENEDMDELKSKYKLLGKGNNKKTKKKKEKIKKLMKACERRENRQEKVKQNKDFMPIDLLNDPSTICEKMFDKLRHVKKQNKNYKLKIALMRLVGRLSGRHKIIVPNFFAYIAAFLKPKQEELATIMASVIEATHHMVSPGELQPIINELFDKFICESYPPQYVTIGVNALREIVERCPTCVNYSQYTAVEDLKKVKNKSVSTATRSFINMVRDVNPDLMENKVNYDEKYGITETKDSIEGVDLLKFYEGIPLDYKLECNELLTDKQLKKLKLLKLKENAEAVQKIRLHLSNTDMGEMLGDSKHEVKTNKSLENKLKEKPKRVKSSKADEEDNFEDEEEEDEEYEDSEEDNEEDDEDLEIDEEEGEEIEDEEIDDDGSILEDNDDAVSYHSEESGYDYDKLNNTNDVKQDLDNILDTDSENNDKAIEDDAESHSFVDEEKINYFKKSFRDKRIELQNEEKTEFKMNRKKKSKGQNTNLDNRKNKPTSMVIHKIKKKQNREHNDKNLAHKIKNTKRQLGRFKRGNMVLKSKGGNNSKKMKKKMGKNKKKNRL